MRPCRTRKFVSVKSQLGPDAKCERTVKWCACGGESDSQMQPRRSSVCSSHFLNGRLKGRLSPQFARRCCSVRPRPHDRHCQVSIAVELSGNQQRRELKVRQRDVRQITSARVVALVRCGGPCLGACAGKVAYTRFVGSELVRGSRIHYHTIIQHIGVISDFETYSRVLLDQQHGDALGFHLLERDCLETRVNPGCERRA
jgi:hypothetical protein